MHAHAHTQLSCTHSCHAHTQLSRTRIHTYTHPHGWPLPINIYDWANHILRDKLPIVSKSRFKVWFYLAILKLISDDPSHLIGKGQPCMSKLLSGMVMYYIQKASFSLRGWVEDHTLCVGFVYTTFVSCNILHPVSLVLYRSLGFCSASCGLMRATQRERQFLSLEQVHTLLSSA